MAATSAPISSAISELLHPSHIYEILNSLHLTISGTIRWNKSFGHPHELAPTVMHKGTHNPPSVFCPAFTVRCTEKKYAVNADPCKTMIPVSVGKISCWDGPSNPTFFQLSYNITELPAATTLTVQVLAKSDIPWDNAGQLPVGVQRRFLLSGSFGNVQPMTDNALCPEDIVGKINVILDNGNPDFAIVNFDMSLL